MPQKISYNTVITLLLEKIPEFRPVYEEYVKDYGVIEHPIIGELKVFFVQQYRSWKNSPDDKERNKIKELLDKILDFIEEIVDCGDTKTEELAYFSFLEMLVNAGEDYEGIKKMLRPKSIKALQEIDDWYARMAKKT
jgi:hypothetical protein